MINKGDIKVGSLLVYVNEKERINYYCKVIRVSSINFEIKWEDDDVVEIYGYDSFSASCLFLVSTIFT